MSSGSQFVVAAYAVILFALVMYMVVIAMKSARIGREVELLSRIIERSRPDDAEKADEGDPASPPVEAVDK